MTTSTTKTTKPSTPVKAIRVAKPKAPTLTAADKLAIENAESCMTATMSTALDTVISSQLEGVRVAADITAANKGMCKTLDRVSNDWTLIKGDKPSFNKDKLNGMSLATFNRIVSIRAEIVAAYKAAGLEAKKIRDIARWSAGFTGTKGLHPVVKKAQKELADKKAASKEGTETKAKPDEVGTKLSMPLAIAAYASVNPLQLAQTIEQTMFAVTALLDASGVAELGNVAQVNYGLAQEALQDALDAVCDITKAKS